MILLELSSKEDVKMGLKFCRDLLFVAKIVAPGKSRLAAKIMEDIRKLEEIEAKFFQENEIIDENCIAKTFSPLPTR